MATIIEKLSTFGFSEDDSREIMAALCNYADAYGRRWKSELRAHWMRAYYPILGVRRSGLMQAVRNSDASNYVTRLTASNIRAELSELAKSNRL